MRLVSVLHIECVSSEGTCSTAPGRDETVQGRARVVGGAGKGTKRALLKRPSSHICQSSSESPVKKKKTRVGEIDTTGEDSRRTRSQSRGAGSNLVRCGFLATFHHVGPEALGLQRKLDRPLGRLREESAISSGPLNRPQY